eukprot:870336_1
MASQELYEEISSNRIVGDIHELTELISLDNHLNIEIESHDTFILHIDNIKSPYNGAKVTLNISEVVLSNFKYPFVPLRMNISTPMFHPNINENGDIEILHRIETVFKTKNDWYNELWRPTVTHSLAKMLLVVSALINAPVFTDIHSKFLTNNDLSLFNEGIELRNDAKEEVFIPTKEALELYEKSYIDWMSTANKKA